MRLRERAQQFSFIQELEEIIGSGRMQVTLPHYKDIKKSWLISGEWILAPVY